MNRTGRVLLAAGVLAGLAVLAAFWLPHRYGPATPGYSAVLLTNGSVYYGRLEGLGSAFPVLRDVFYVQAGVDPGTKQATGVLIRRGKEWHGPDRMVLSAGHIVLVEPVREGSRVADLIAGAPR